MPVNPKQRRKLKIERKILKLKMIDSYDSSTDLEPCRNKMANKNETRFKRYNGISIKKLARKFKT